LFVGSGSVIHSAGPAAVLAYLAGGILVVLIMRMLGEMATPRPTPARSPPTPTAPSAVGPVSPSAGCTGGTGSFLMAWEAYVAGKILHGSSPT
jgi:Gamma-aminobutyrate permease and related permeases